MMKAGIFHFILCASAVLSTAQVTFNPDPAGDVQLSITSLTPTVSITTDLCYSSAPTIKVQYVTIVDNEVVFTIYDGVNADPVAGATCEHGESQYRYGLHYFRFIAVPALVGGTFRLKATVNNNDGDSTFSRRTYSFPAPFNLTGSSVNAVLNSQFTWCCHVTADYPVIEWIRDSTRLGQMGILPNGSCITVYMDAFLYSCHPSALTYTLTIPGSNLTELLQATTWRCRDATNELKGSKLKKLDIIVPVTTVTISPGSGSTIDVYDNQETNFTCITNNANPPPTIFWYLGSSDVTSQAGFDRTTLTLDVTILYHQMSVMCVAWNSGNTANMSDSITLNVISSAKFFTDQRYQVIHLNKTASVGITFYCNPPATMSGVEWINKTDLNDQPVEASDVVSLSIVEDDVEMIKGNSNRTLTGQIAFLNITSAESYHSGYYVLKIRNGVSLVSGRGIMIEVTEASGGKRYGSLEALPESPGNLTVQCRASVAQLSWTSTDIYSSELSFHLLYKEEDENKFTVMEKEYDNRGRDQILKANVLNLKPRTVYNFKVASKSGHGLSEYTKTKTCATFGDTADTSSAGSNVGGVAAGITCVFLLLIGILIGFIVMRERRYRSEKGGAAKGNMDSSEKYDDFQTANYSNEQDFEVDESQNERSTYEDLQNSTDDHTYDHV